MKDIRAFLEASTKESLVELIVDHAKHDAALRQRLVLETAKSGAHSSNVEAYRSAIDDAIDPDGFVDYRRARSSNCPGSRTIGSSSGVRCACIGGRSGERGHLR
jgi:hypothetical protein